MEDVEYLHRKQMKWKKNENNDAKMEGVGHPIWERQDGKYAERYRTQGIKWKRKEKGTKGNRNWGRQLGT